jgi:hypothetical protein
LAETESFEKKTRIFVSSVCLIYTYYIMETKDKIYAAMKKSGKELRTGEIAELAGLDKKEVEKAVKALSTEDRIFSPKRCFWKVK